MVLGGIVGWMFHFYQPPVYEAKASITITMDFEKRQLTQYEEDYAFGAAGAIITSTEVMNLIIAEAQAQGYLIGLTQLQQRIFLEGKQSVWELRVRDRDPKVAAELTNIWAEKATYALNIALEHALRAEQLQYQIDGLGSCLPGTAVTPQPLAPLDCQGFSPKEIQVMLQDRTNELVQEKSLSLGIIPIMAIGLTEFATVPEKPVIYGQADLVMAGACIGLVVSLWIANCMKVSRRD
jgi:uncharacterized protein involved in exopolysaccharide biosynthesis